MHSRTIFLCGYSLLISISSSCCRQISLIAILVGENPSYGRPAVVPMFDVALEWTARMYPRLFRNISHQVLFQYTTDSSCGNAGDLMYSFSGNLLNQIDHSKSFPILITPGCSLEIIALGDIARELNVPFMITTATDARLDNRARYPTRSSISPSGLGGTSFAIRQFMRQNSWRTASVLCDTLSHLISASAYYGVLCRTLLQLLGQNFGEFQIFQETFDSTNDAFDALSYQLLLRRVKRQSRIVIIASNPDVITEFLISAHQMNMTNKDFVYIYPEAIVTQGTSRLIWNENSWAVMNDTYKMAALEAYSSVIMFRNPLPDWTTLSPFTRAVAKRAKEFYNYTYDADQYENDNALAIRDAIVILAQVLDESQTDIENMTAKRFSQLIAGRDFNVGYRNVTMLPNGVRYRDTSIHRFNPVKKTFDVSWLHSWKTNRVEIIEPLLARNWYGSATLPTDQPLCGFQDALCVSLEAKVTTTIAISTVLICMAVVIVIGISASRFRQRNEIWWYLPSGIDRTASTAMKRRHLISSKPQVRFSYYTSLEWTGN